MRREGGSSDVCFPGYYLLLYFLRTVMVYRDLPGRNRVAWYFRRSPDEANRPPGLFSHSFEAADRLVSFSAGNFLDIGPELAAS